MAYDITKYQGSFTYTINNNQVFNAKPSGSVSASSPISLIGRNKTNFGKIMNENYLWTVENFASDHKTVPNDNDEYNVGPYQAVQGQIWFKYNYDDNSINEGGYPLICVKEGEISSSADSWKWSPITTATYSDIEPFSTSFKAQDNIVDVNYDTVPVGQMWIDSNSNSININNGLLWKEVLTLEEVASVPEYADNNARNAAGITKTGLIYVLDNGSGVSELQIGTGTTWKVVALT